MTHEEMTEYLLIRSLFKDTESSSISFIEVMVGSHIFSVDKENLKERLYELQEKIERKYN